MNITQENYRPVLSVTITESSLFISMDDLITKTISISKNIFSYSQSIDTISVDLQNNPINVVYISQ